jgi:hypothetical protein
MATLKNVEESQQKQVETESYVPPALEAPVTALVTEYIIYKLVDSKKKGRVYIDGIDDVINPGTKKLERIYLITGAHSIWSSDLVELLKDKDYMRRNRRSLMFEGCICRIPSWDERAIEYAKVTRHNIGSPNRKSGSKYEFFEYNPAKQQEEALKKEMFELDMAIKAKEMPVDKMKKLATYLGIIFYDELGQPKSEDGIRRELMLKAKKDPITFEKYLESKEVEIAYMVKKAILDNLIDLGSQNGNAIWGKGQGFIAKIPQARKPQEYLTELAMTNSDDGKRFLEQLQTMVK